VDKEMWQIHETKYQSQINDLELEIQQLHKNYTEAQNEVIKLNASNCSYKIEVNHLKEEIERMKEMTTMRSEVSSPYTTTLSTNLQSLDKVAFMTVGASSQMFKNRSKYVFIF
jgi:peptidoglycan hydrolase CwlO-like protein